MSKLGLGRAKLATRVLSAFGQEPPDKKRKTDDSVTADASWDDDGMDILLTQNMNKLDNLIASTQSAVPSGYDELATNCSDRPHHISKSTFDSVGEEVCSVIGQQTTSSIGKRVIGHGSSHSRSAECINNSPSSSGSSVKLARKGSFSIEKSCAKNKESDKQQSWTTFQAKAAAGSSDVVKNLHTTDTVTTNTLPMRLDANANCTEMKLTQITEECEYYKSEVCVQLSLVYIINIFHCLVSCCVEYICRQTREPHCCV